MGRYVGSGDIIVNPVVFDLDYIPEELPFREDQLRVLAREITFFVERGMKTNLFLYGPPGTGKTATIRRIYSETNTEYPNVKTIYINAWKYRTRASILFEIARQIGLPVPYRGVSSDVVVEHLDRYVENNKVIIALDEADKLTGNQDVLYDLSRLGSKALLITVANGKDFLSLLDPRITSTLFHSDLEFPPYTVDQLTEILRRRAEIGLRPGSYDNTILRICAAVGFSRGGDARIAIACLANAAKEAEVSGSNRITQDHVRRVKDGLVAKGEIDPKLQMIIDILREKGPLTTGDLYRIYRDKVPVTERSFRNYIKELHRLGMVDLKRVKTRGNVRLISLKV